jgi:IclR family mhp operon transcriptional activator
MTCYRPINSVLRAFDVIEAINRRGVSTLEYLHQETSLPKATLVRLLNTFVHRGLVKRGPRHGTYHLTGQIRALSSGYHSEPQMIEAAAPVAIQLTREIKWPLGVAVFERDSMVIQYSSIPYSPIAPYHSVLNRRYTMLGSAMGRAYIASCSAEERNMILGMLKESENPTEARRAADPRAVRQVVDQTLRQGYAVRDPAERPDTQSIGVPIFDGDTLAGSMAIAWFRSALTLTEAIDRYAERLQDAAAEISVRCQALRLATPNGLHKLAPVVG